MASQSVVKTTSKSFSSSSFTYKRQKVLISILFLAVPLALLLIFTYLPAINMVLYSFTKWDGFGAIDEYIGLQNYNDKKTVRFRNLRIKELPVAAQP